MQYRIEGTPLPVVICDLKQGEQMITESGGMSWMTNGMEMSTNMEGGLMKGLGRMFSGESLFLTFYTCKVPQGMIAFASSFPGSILPFHLEPGRSIIAQKSSFLASEASVTLSAFFNRKFGSGLFGGEGFVMQKLSGQGTAFLEIDGHSMEYDLAPGEILKIDSGHLAAMTDTVKMDIETVKGVTNVLFGGEGLFNTVLTGPGKVWLQTMPALNVAKAVAPFITSSK